MTMRTFRLCYKLSKQNKIPFPNIYAFRHCSLHRNSTQFFERLLKWLPLSGLSCCALAYIHLSGIGAACSRLRDSRKSANMRKRVRRKAWGLGRSWIPRVSYFRVPGRPYYRRAWNRLGLTERRGLNLVYLWQIPQLPIKMAANVVTGGGIRKRKFAKRTTKSAVASPYSLL